MVAADVLAKAFGGARSIAGGWRCNCPLHDNTKPWLVLYDGYPPMCERGCDSKLILDAYTAKQNGVIRPSKSSYKSLQLSQWITEPIVESTPLLQGVFDAGDKVVIIGKSKTRKSFFMQQLAFCIATGRSFLGFPALPAKRVLIIQFEIKKDRFHVRCVKMAESMGIEAIELNSLWINNARGVDVEYAALIRDQIEELKPELIVLDPLYKLIDGDENKSEDIKKVLKFFDTLTESSKAAILYIHHDKKGSVGETELTDRGSGSGILGRDFDSSLLLAAHATSDSTLVLDFVTRNHAPKPSISIEWFNYSFKLSHLPPDKMTSRQTNNPKKNLDNLIDRARGVIRAEFEDDVLELGAGILKQKFEDAGIPGPKVTTIRSEMVAQGWITKGNRKATKGESSTYFTLHPPIKVVVTPDEEVLFNDHEDSFF